MSRCIKLSFTMTKKVLVSYPDLSDSPLKVKYKISNSGGIKTINCVMSTDQTLPNWLQLRKFDFRSLKAEGAYNLLFEEKKFEKNLDTVLFLDRVYEEIMTAGNHPIG